MLTRRMTEAPSFTRLRGEMDRLFERFFAEHEPYRTWDPFAPRRYPAVNVWQDDDSFHVEAELPGLTEKDIEVTVTGNELTIAGERPVIEETGRTVHRRERRGGAFSRIVHLPESVDESRIEAAFRDGVLTVTVARAESAKPRRIPVKMLSA